MLPDKSSLPFCGHVAPFLPDKSSLPLCGHVAPFLPDKSSLPLCGHVAPFLPDKSSLTLCVHVAPFLPDKSSLSLCVHVAPFLPDKSSLSFCGHVATGLGLLLSHQRSLAPAHKNNLIICYFGTEKTRKSENNIIFNLWISLSFYRPWIVRLKYFEMASISRRYLPFSAVVSHLRILGLSQRIYILYRTDSNPLRLS